MVPANTPRQAREQPPAPPVEADRDPMFELRSESELISAPVNALIARSKKDGPALLAAWHRARRSSGVAEGSNPDAEA